jgi:hypothetical protein
MDGDVRRRKAVIRGEPRFAWALPGGWFAIVIVDAAAWVGSDRDEICNQVQEDVGQREEQRAGLDHGDVPRSHGVDERLADAGIDEHDFDDHRPDDEIGEVEGDDAGDRCQRVRQRVAKHYPQRRGALQPRHLDIGTARVRR